MYVPMIEQAATANAVPASEISALIEIESGFRPEHLVITTVLLV